MGFLPYGTGVIAEEGAVDVVTCVVVLYPVQSPHVRVRASAPTQAAGGPSSRQHKGTPTLDAQGIGNARVEWGLQHVSGIQLTVGDTIENSLQRLPSSFFDISSTYATTTKGNDRPSPTPTHQQAR